MREIKFRAKASGTCLGKPIDKWHYGCLSYWAGNYQIWETEEDGQTHNYGVRAETVGQFTGLRDRNGKEIYEGDIIKYDLDFEPNERVNLIGSVVFDFGAFCAERELRDSVYSRCYLREYHNIEVLGNIHDNPEMLEAVCTR